eukprot:300785-Rhodomonas_salina.1
MVLGCAVLYQGCTVLGQGKHGTCASSTRLRHASTRPRVAVLVARARRQYQDIAKVAPDLLRKVHGHRVLAVRGPEVRAQQRVDDLELLCALAVHRHAAQERVAPHHHAVRVLVAELDQHRPDGLDAVLPLPHHLQLLRQQLARVRHVVRLLRGSSLRVR